MYNLYYKIALTKILTILFLTSFSQSIHIKSSQTLSPLPYASVLNVSKGQLHFTNETGIVPGGFEIGDSIFITHIGYKDLRSRITESNQIFLLQQSELTLDTVRVKSCKNAIKQEYLNLASETDTRFLGVCCWPKGATNVRVAVLLKPESGSHRLNSFSVWLKPAWGAPKSTIRTPIRFTFYDVDESSMLPGETISNQQVIYYPKKEGKQTVDVDSLHLWFGAAGIYVAMEYISSDEKHQYTRRYVDTAKGIDSVAVYIGAQIDGVYSKDFSLAFYNYQTATWSFAGNRSKPAPTERWGTIKFSAEVTKCKE
jgi:hypothetical protein